MRAVSEGFEAKISHLGRGAGGLVPGAERWAAPEVLAGQPAGKEADAYSFGITLYEVSINHYFLYRVVNNTSGAPSSGEPLATSHRVYYVIFLS